MAARKKAVDRVRMSEADVEKYLKHYGKERDLRGKELEHAIRRCAATRWAALERNSKGKGKGKSKPKAKPKAKPKLKVVHKKAA